MAHLHKTRKGNKINQSGKNTRTHTNIDDHEKQIIFVSLAKRNVCVCMCVLQTHRLTNDKIGPNANATTKATANKQKSEINVIFIAS